MKPNLVHWLDRSAAHIKLLTLQDLNNFKCVPRVHPNWINSWVPTKKSLERQHHLPLRNGFSDKFLPKGLLLKFSVHIKHTAILLKCRFQAKNPKASDSVSLVETQNSAFLTSPQVILRQMLCRPHSLHYVLPEGTFPLSAFSQCKKTFFLILSPFPKENRSINLLFFLFQSFHTYFFFKNKMSELFPMYGLILPSS